jgi:hypothetical protein
MQPSVPLDVAMFSSASVIDPVMLQAYLETEYRVHGDLPLTLEIGVASKALSALYKTSRVTSCAFITACNPFSQAFDDDANRAREAALERELQTRSLGFIDGIGQHPSNQWPGESSFLVLGLSLEAAKALGAKYEQNGIVWCGPDAVPQLILLR